MKAAQIVTAPSLHRSGNLYEWKNWPGQVLPAPAALLAILKESTSFRPALPASQARFRPMTAAGRYSEVFPRGQRNEAVFRYACGLCWGRPFNRQNQNRGPVIQ
jgi:hypothetical protein